MIIESDAGKEVSAQIEGPFKTTTLMMKGVYLLENQDEDQHQDSRSVFSAG